MEAMDHSRITHGSLARHSPPLTMQPRSDSPIWVQGLRAQLRTTVGPAFRLGEQRGKAKLDVRYADSTRGTAVLLHTLIEEVARGVDPWGCPGFVDRSIGVTP